MTSLEIYQLFRDQFRAIDTNLDKLARACTTHDQTVQLNQDWTDAQTNYINARNRIFKEDDKVTSLAQQIKGLQKTIDTDLTDLKDIAATLDEISDVVHLGTTLLSLATAV
jgi:predicted  nucleic acid-binding Zn-ribbon protein